MTIDIPALAKRFNAPPIQAIALLGSHARGDAGPYSDVDLARFMAEDDAETSGNGSHLIDGTLVVVSNVTPSQIERWFTQPNEAVAVIAGLRQGGPLIDPDGLFVRVQERANSFTWDEAMQARANAYAGEQMVGWIEEAHKGLEGLRRHDTGRLLNARFGLSWGLSHVMQVYGGVLILGDNHFYDAMAETMGGDSEWTRLRASAFGMAAPDGPAPSLHQSVVAGLRLYALTADMLDDDLLPEHRTLVTTTARLIRGQLPGLQAGWPEIQTRRT